MYLHSTIFLTCHHLFNIIYIDYNTEILCVLFITFLRRFFGLVMYTIACLSIIMILETLDKQEGVPKVYNRMEVQVKMSFLARKVYLHIANTNFLIF